MYAAGDVASRYQFTHVADALARIVLENALFLRRKKASALHVPWCRYTSPEIAHVGLYEHEAVAAGYAVDTITIPMEEVDRAVLDGDEEGFLRVHLAKGSDRILGATLVAARAGDMISELTVAMAAGRGLGTIAGAIHPYPTQAEVMKKAADAYNRSRLTPRVSHGGSGFDAERAGGARGPTRCNISTRSGIFTPESRLLAQSESLAALSRSQGGAIRWELVKIDVDRAENQPAGDRFGVRAVPTVSLLDERGAEIVHLVGTRAKLNFEK